MSSAWTFLTQPLITAQKNAGMTVDVAFDTDVKSTTWDGGTSLSGGKDTGATAGYLIDFETGAAQFQIIYAEGGSLGTLDVDGTLTMGTGGKIRTASSGQRIEIDNADSNRIYFYSGDAAEVKSSRIRQYVNGTGTTMTLRTGLFGAYVNTDDQAVSLTARSASADGTTYSPRLVVGVDVNKPGAGSGLAPIFQIRDGIAMTTDGDITLTAGAIQLGALGSAAAPAVGLGSNYDDGMYSSTDGTLNFATSGVQRFNVNSTRFNLATGNIDFLKLPTKNTTGDPSGGTGGDMYVNNSADRALRLYSNGAWRTVASW